MTIFEYLTAIKERLLTDPIVSDFYILRERVSLSDGHLRARLTLSDNTWLEFSEYVQRSRAERINVITYSYHWANADNELIKRWDNTPHFPNLAGFPHHIHLGPADKVTSGQPMSIFMVLNEIAGKLTQP